MGNTTVYTCMSGFESNGGQNVIFYDGIEWESTDFNCTGMIYVRNIFQITDEMCFSIISHLCYILLVLSSPELKAHMSFSDHLSSVVCLSIRLSVNFSHFHLLLQNHWANFNQTWHKASLGEGDSSLFK